MPKLRRMPRLSAASIAACVLLCALPAPLAAQGQAEPPSVATAGLDVFVTTGADSAIAVWLSGTTFDTPATRASLGQGFARMAEQRGPMLGYDVVRVLLIGTQVRRVYAVLHYEQGPGYLYLELFRTPGGWVTQAVQFNAVPEVLRCTQRGDLQSSPWSFHMRWEIRQPRSPRRSSERYVPSDSNCAPS